MAIAIFEKIGEHMGSKKELKWFFLVVAIVIFFIAVERDIHGARWYLCVGVSALLISGFLENGAEYENLLYRIPAGISFLAYVIALTIAFALNK